MAEQKELCACIEDVAQKVDFIKIGSNDLTASVLGISRGDTVARARYREENGFDPFVHPAPEVFQVVIPDLIARARNANPQIKIALCGDHASSADVVVAMSRLGVEEFSVSPTDENLYLLPLRTLLALSAGQQGAEMSRYPSPPSYSPNS